MPTKEIEDIRSHADKLKAEIIKESGARPDPNGAATAALVPEFSKGTRALDETTGLPVGEQAPAFSDTTVGKPEGTEITGKTPEAQAVAAPAAEPRKRDEKTGQFVGEPPAAGAAATVAPEPQSGQAPAQAAAGAAAAAEAAAQVVDESEEWEFKDPDLEVPIKLKYDKKFHDTVQRAFPRRADYDRLRNRLGEAEPVLRPMLENGAIKQVLPLLQMAQQDREFADAVWTMHARRLQGLPLVEQAPQQTQHQPQGQPQFQPPAAQPFPGQEAPFVDPLLESALQPYEQKWQQRYSALESKFTTMAEQQQQAAARQREEQQRQAGIANEMMAAHQDLSSMFPGEFNVSLGPNDPGWQKAQSMTQQGGYAQTYGIRAGLIFGYQRAREIEQERLAATASPAAQSLAEVDNRQVQLAREQAAQAARAVAGGTPTQATPPPPRPRPATTMQLKDGSIVKRPVDEYLTDLTAYVKEQEQRAS